MAYTNKTIYLENFPRWGKGNTAREGTINWSECLGEKVRFIYDDIEGEIEIVDYICGKNVLTINYDNKNFNIRTNDFIKCKLGGILNKVTKEYKIEINQQIKDNDKDLIIIDREHRRVKKNRSGKIIYETQKWYKYKCNKCGYVGWCIEHSLIRLKKCACCSNQVIVLGINTIWDTDRWMCDLGISEEDANKYAKSSNKKVKVICPYCRNVKEILLSNLYKTKSIGCKVCGDSVSYPEKFINNFLRQLSVNFETEKALFKSMSKKVRYDFYFKHNNKEYIIETHGRQHYDCGTGFDIYGGRTFEEESKNDEYKKQLAIENGIKNYIVLDCRYSELEWIKKSVLDSELNNTFDLSKINWDKCEEFAIGSNLVKEICDYWNNKKEWETSTNLEKVFSCSKSKILSSLKKGAKLGWCDYNAREEVSKSGRVTGKNKAKSLECFKNGKSLGVFNSASEVVEIFKTRYGIKLVNSGIYSVCSGRFEKYKGFTFKYLKD